MAIKLSMEKYCGLGECDYILTEKYVENGCEYAPHWHDYFELEIILEGKAQHMYNTNVYEMSRGSAYLMSYYDFHSLKASEDVKLVNISFREGILNDELRASLSVPYFGLMCEFGEEELSLIASLVKKINDESKNKNILGDFIAKNAVLEIIIMLLRKALPQGFVQTPHTIQAAVALIHKNFRLPVSLEELSEELKISVNYLGVLFKRYTGMSFNAYLNTIRLKYACELLASTDLTVREIAFASGYGSAEYFAYVFKKRFLITPKTYSELAKEKKTEKSFAKTDILS